MYTRKELKEKAKTAFHRNYWKTVLITIILGLVGGESVISSSADNGQDLIDEFTNNSSGSGVADSSFWSSIDLQVIVIFCVIAACIIVAVLLLKIFVFNPLKVGAMYYYEENSKEPVKVAVILRGFQGKNYISTVKAMFFRDLYLFLWSLLAVIPALIIAGIGIYYVTFNHSNGPLVNGIAVVIIATIILIVGIVVMAMKRYQYSMIPYLIAANPELSTKKVFELTKTMMHKQKWNAFVLDVSFFGWAILSSIPFVGFIVGIFYISPYYQCTWVEFFKENQKRILEEGLVPEQDLVTI